MLLSNIGNKKVDGDMFQFFRARKAEKQTAYALYKALVDQARHPSFYTDYAVEDTIEGRFDMILLHLFLVDDRLDQAGEEYVSLRRNLHEAMVSDLDRSFREIGVGDMSVGKEMKKVGSAWLGRHTAYGKALVDGAEEGALEQALEKNLYAEQENAPAAQMAQYVRKARQVLTLSKLETILEGKLVFPVPDNMDKSE